MGLDAAQRRERDRALLREAHAHDLSGIAILDKSEPKAMADLRAWNAQRRAKVKSATTGPWVLGVRQISAERRNVQAQRAFKRADAAYWVLVMHWEALLHKLAQMDEFRFRLPPQELRGMYYEIGYHVAIRLDVDRAIFGTYLMHWRHNFLGRAPEVMSMVHAPTSVLGLSAMRTMESLDAPPEVNAATGATGPARLDLLVAEGGHQSLEDRSTFAAIYSRLSEGERERMDAYRTCERLDDVGERFGFGRERARQVRDELILKSRKILRVPKDAPRIAF